MNEAKTHLDESVDGKNNKFRLCLRIIHQIQIHEFLLLQIIRLL